MAKERKDRVSHISDEINRLQVEKDNVISEYTKVELVNIREICELTLDDNRTMFNRLTYPKSKLLELANNIREIAMVNSGILGTGILQPIMVRRKNNKIERIHGENRIEALKINKQEFAPVIVMENVSDELARFMRSSENLAREDLNPYDETISILEHIQLACKFETIENVKSFIHKIKNYKSNKSSLNEDEIELYHNVTAVFTKIGRFDPITFVDRLSLLNMNPIIIEGMTSGVLSYSQAKLINSKLKTDLEIRKIIDALKKKNMSIKELKDFILNMIETNGEDKESSLGLKVRDFKVFLNKLGKHNYNKLDKETKKEIDIKFEQVEKLMKEIDSYFITS